MSKTLNYEVISVFRSESSVIVDFQSLENGSIYRAIWELGMQVHIDFHFDHDTWSTAGTTITPLIRESVKAKN